MSRGRIFRQIFGELQQFSHVPVDLFKRFATEIGLAGKAQKILKVHSHRAAMATPLKPTTYNV